MDKPRNSRELYISLLRHVRPYWKMFALSLASMVVLAATEPAMPALMKPLLDGSFIDKDPVMIRTIPLLLILVFLVRGLASYISTVTLNWVSGKVIMDLRNLMFGKLLALPGSYYDDNPSGNVISKLIYNVDQVAQAASNVLLVIVRDSLAVIGLLAWMIYIDWKLSLVFLLVIPATGLVIKLVSSRLRSLSRTLQTIMGNMTHILDEAIRGNRVVKLFGGQAYEGERFRDATNQVRQFNFKVIATSAANVPIVQLIAVIALAFIVYMSSLQSLSDKFSVGEFISFFAAMALLFSPIKRLTKINESLQRGLAASESIFDLLDLDSEKDTGTRHLQQVRGHIEFQNVSFRYGANAEHTLQNISFTIEPGETIALVGKSGSGKSTLANMLPRFYSPASGKILLDNIDIEELRLKNLRENISLVSQDVVLFNDTVAANIAYGTLQSASPEAIEAAAVAAHAMEFINNMPDGMETLIGEDGARLSGGQRQRISIARALLKDSPILILDEATSALDSESEKHVQTALETLMAGRTAIIIAHRLSTVERADRIIVLQEGRIAETGTHQELLDHGGIYHNLHQLQMMPTW